MRHRLVSLERIVEGLPQTNKLFLTDSYQRELETSLLKYVPESRKTGYLVTSETIMHPRGGAQPSDSGTIGCDLFTARVKKVLEHSGVVIHYGEILKGSPEPGSQVRMSIDWDARYRVMRLHTAGHIVDYAVLMEVGGGLLSSKAFHGPPESFVEYMGRMQNLSPSELERISNEVVRQARRVYPVWVDRKELQYTVRGAPNVARLPELQTYRIIVIDGVNAIPCGGTHVAETSEVGRIVVKEVRPVESGFRVVYDVLDG